MSRPSGPGGTGMPPNGWPAGNQPLDNQSGYGQRPQAPGQQQPPQTRPPRIQPAPPSRTPLTGLPPGMTQPQQGYAPPGQPPQNYAPPQYAPQQAATPQAPQYAPPQAYAPPQQTYPVERTQQPTRPPQQADPRYGAYPGPDYAAPAAPLRPAAPVAYPQYALPQPPQPQQYTATPQAYVPEQQQVRTQPPQQRDQRPAPSLEPWPAQPAHTHQAAPAVDPYGYDLGNYMPSAAPSPDTRSQRAPGPAAPAPASWPGAYADPQTQPGRGGPPARSQEYTSKDHGHDAYASVPVPQPDIQASALEPVYDEEEYDEEEEFDEPPRTTRYGLIAASLMGAIVAGGGLAYAYKVFVAPASQLAGGLPIIKNAGAPPKVRPSEPGGTKFADQGPKTMEAMEKAQGTVAAAASGDGGPISVQTMEFSRDGRQLKPAPKPVPGMVLEGGPQPSLSPPAPTPPPVAAAEPVPVAPPVAAAPVVPRKIATAPVAASIAPETSALPAPKKPVVPKPPKATAGPNGFVAVLASMPASATSKNQSMQQFADLQQKYPDVLGGKSPDIVDAKVKVKDQVQDYHRTVAGPPGSRDAATAVCTQLKAAGYTGDCWVTGY